MGTILKLLGELVLFGLDCGIGIASSIPLQIYMGKANGVVPLLAPKACLGDYSFPQFSGTFMWIFFCTLLFRVLRLACWDKIKKKHYYYKKSLFRVRGGGQQQQQQQEDNYKVVEKVRELVLGFLDAGIGFGFSIPLQIYLGQFYPPKNHQQDCNSGSISKLGITVSIFFFSVIFKELLLPCCFKIKDHYYFTTKGAEELV